MTLPGSAGRAALLRGSARLPFDVGAFTPLGPSFTRRTGASGDSRPCDGPDLNTLGPVDSSVVMTQPHECSMNAARRDVSAWCHECAAYLRASQT